MRLVIGLPVFNGEAFLETTVRALLAQSFAGFQLIISDNASTDATGDIAQALAVEDSRVVYRRNPRNIGLAANFNLTFDQSESELFKWATADDVCLPGYLERCVAALDQNPGAVLAYPRTRFIGASGSDLAIEDPGWDLRNPAPAERLQFVLHAGHWVNSVLGVMRRSALARTRRMPAYPGGDYALLGELALLGTFLEVPEVLYSRRLHRHATSQHASDPGWLAGYFYGTGRRRRHAGWRRHLAHARTIIGADLPATTKLTLLGSLGRAMQDRRDQLWRELWADKVKESTP